ncbi:hypothetical protein N7456_003230 [Penicillium angulare]|uniref:non-specific serine/threonine protein kinase n=1 Tax=Penicillium angulare TaxID=116970 RepID=A0A9W9FUA3_9EURO|nr:hypothetical protein N7456_003230 [Penicillium angulare]
MADKPQIEYNWIRGVERLEEYRPGGYHPITIGDMLHDRYQIADKLGFGGYSTVWLAQDTHLKRYVALKVNISDHIPRETDVLKSLAVTNSPPYCGRGLLPIVLDEFEVQGPNGKHSCYTVLPAQCNLREISFSRLFSLEVARALSYELVLAVAYIHSQGYVHGVKYRLLKAHYSDIHLNNLLVKLPHSFDKLSIKQLYEEYGEPETVPISRQDGESLSPSVPENAVVPIFLGTYAEKFTLSDAHLILSDFGEAFSPTKETRNGQDCHTPPAFRAPEAKFEPHSPLSYPSDIWSLATAIWEIVGMKAIFTTDYVPDDEIVAQHVDVLGPLPSEWWCSWEARSRYFDEHGNSTDSYKINKLPPLEGSFEYGIQSSRRRWGCEIEESEAAAFLDLIRSMLSFRPEARPTADEILGSEWMTKWARPCYEQSQKLLQSKDIGE